MRFRTLGRIPQISTRGGAQFPPAVGRQREHLLMEKILSFRRTYLGSRGDIPLVLEAKAREKGKSVCSMMRAAKQVSSKFVVKIQQQYTDLICSSL